MNRMSRCINRYIRSNHTIIADRYLCNVNYRTVVICKKLLAHFNIKAVIAVKRRIHKWLVRFAEQLFDNFLYSVKIGTVHKIELLQNSSALNLLSKSLVVAYIRQALISAFNLIHNVLLKLYHTIQLHLIPSHLFLSYKKTPKEITYRLYIISVCSATRN